jgi:diaminopimelate epimerase
MHGLGNDYVFVDCFQEKVQTPSKLAPILSDRHRGIGADGLILVCPSQKAHVRMRMFNADGSEAEMCGNGVRCLAKYVYEQGLTKIGGTFSVPGRQPCPASLDIETGKEIVSAGLLTDQNDKVRRVCVNMGRPILASKDIPVRLDADKVVEHPIEVLGHELHMTCASMGNPHAVFFCDDVALVELEKLGPAIEHHDFFPNRTNVHFVQVEGPDAFSMRTWERGSGITMACGSGACAACVASVLTKRQNRACTGHLPGGDLDLYWAEEDNCVYMTGPAVEVFQGTWPNEAT